MATSFLSLNLCPFSAVCLYFCNFFCLSGELKSVIILVEFSEVFLYHLVVNKDSYYSDSVMSHSYRVCQIQVYPFESRELFISEHYPA